MKPVLLLSILSAFLLVSCTPGLVTREDTAAAPVSNSGWWTQSFYSYPANDTAWPCSLDKSGTGGAPDMPGMMLVGYDHAYDAGSRPFPCSRQLNHVYRASMQFDLSEITNLLPRVFVTSATLHYKRQPDPAEGRQCGDSLLIASENWEAAGYKKLPPGDVYRTSLPTSGPLCGLGGCGIDVTSAVRNWVSGAEPQYGFVLKGENEATDSKDNDVCRTRYSDISLTVNYKYDLVPIFPPEK